MQPGIMYYVDMVMDYTAFLIVLWIGIEFVWWLMGALYRQTLLFIDCMVQLLIQGASRLGTYLKALVCEGLALVFNVLWGTWLRLYQPCFLAAQHLSIAVRQYVKLRQLFWKYGRQEFASFAQFKRHVLGEKEPSPKEESKKPAAPEKSAYAQALEVLGFSESQSFDKAMLKARHRELAAVLHPDKAFPNQVFMQQVNDAVDCIKRAKKWK